MPIFEYKGLDRNGKNVKNVIDADNIRAARAKLKKDQIYVIEIKDKKKSTGSSKKKIVRTKSVSVKDFALMTRQLATLIKANIPLVDALSALSEQVEEPVLAEALADCKNMVNEGSTFHKALTKYPNIFSNIFITMVEAGEASGSLDTILMRLAEFSEAQAELQAKVRSAMMYPIIMMIVITGVMSGLFLYVIPKIVVVFESFPDIQLPWITLVIIDFSNIMVNYWYIIFGIITIAILIFLNWKKSPNGRKQWDAISLKLPVFGPMIKMIAVSRFTRTLSTLLSGGVPMLGALDIVRNVVDNHVIATAIDDARSNISEGESIAGPLRKSGQFPPIVIHMVNIGEKTGEIENMLTQVSNAYDFQVKNKIEGLTSLMGPVITIIMGLVISIIVFSIMIPMFQMTDIGG